MANDARPGVVTRRGPAHLDPGAADGFHVARQRGDYRGAGVRPAAQRQQPSEHLHHQPRHRRPHRPHLHHDHRGQADFRRVLYYHYYY